MSLLKKCLALKKSDNIKKDRLNVEGDRKEVRCTCFEYELCRGSDSKQGNQPRKCMCASQKTKVSKSSSCVCKVCEQLRTPEGLQSLWDSVPRHKRPSSAKAKPSVSTTSAGHQAKLTSSTDALSVTVACPDPLKMNVAKTGFLPGYPPQIPLSRDGEENYKKYRDSLQHNKEQDTSFVPPPNRTIGEHSSPRPHHPTVAPLGSGAGSKSQTSHRVPVQYSSTGSSQHSHSSPSPQGGTNTILLLDEVFK
jgi:hypothetical protein